MRKTWLIAVLALALCPLGASAQEYVIKIHPPGLGDKSKVKLADSSDTTFKLLDGNGTTLEDKKESKSHKFSFVEIGLERAPAGTDLVRIKRQYEHAERTKDSVRDTLPYQGKTLIIEKKDGPFHFQIEGDEAITGKEAEELHEEFNKGDFRKLLNHAFLPQKAVKENATWKIDVAPLARDFGKDGKIEVDDTKSVGHGKLVKVYEKNGKQYGVIRLTMEFPVKALVDNGNRTPVKEGKITIRLERDGAIDGSVEPSHLKIHFEADLRADLNANNMDLTLLLSVRAMAEEQRMPLTK